MEIQYEMKRKTKDNREKESYLEYENKKDREY